MQEERYWQAVLDRDSQANGSFVYAVRSTGIYCNPSCPSRRPQRQHVLFFKRPEAAEKAGFRPCRRCHPGEQSLLETQVELVQHACRYIETHLEGPLTLSALGDSDTTLESALASEYPAAQIQRDDHHLGQWVNALLDYLNGEQPHLNLPIDVQATAFQWRVWEELQSIPYGSTRSYREIARAV